jgi:putative membrane-bound dehydrogenase-like protein
MSVIVPVILWLVVALGDRESTRLVASDSPTGNAPELHVPSGFVVERCAAERAVSFPMFGTFDERGRLFVAESSGLDLYAEIAAGTRKCRVTVLEDRNRDGFFEESHVFADRLVFPMGLAWRDSRLYVADPPDLVALEDTDGDGRADRRTVILTGFGHIDNGSLHGLVFGPDGLLYMTMGSPDGYRLATRDGARLEGKSGAFIRCRPDGSHPEVVCRGFVNLVEVVFLPGGDAIGTDNWYQEPSGGFRDALVHLTEGGLYPYVPDEGTPQPVTGDPLPPVARFPAVALSGLVRYRGIAFPDEYRGNLYSAQHNARKVTRHVLIRDGSTFRSEDSDFLTTDDPDFHPSDVLEDADGSLLVVDTGAWYVQHCPTGRIRESRSRGAIYRVRRASGSRLADPRGLEIDWPSLSAGRLSGLMTDPRPAVRDRAGRMLAGRGADAIAPLARVLSGPASDGKAEAVWAQSAIADAAALRRLRMALSDADLNVATSAARALAHRADRGAAPAFERLLAAGEPPRRLAAAEALGRCGDLRSLPAIWQALAARPDRFLEHALVHAAHRLADANALEVALARPEPIVQRAALLLLDQPPRPSGRLSPGTVVARASSPDSGLRRAALHVLTRHPEWAGHALDHIRVELAATGASQEQLDGLAELVLAYQHHSAVQELLGGTAADAAAPALRRAWAIATLTRSRLTPVPGCWITAVARSIRDADASVRRAAVRAARLLQVKELDTILLALADEPGEPPDLRLEALRGALPRHPTLSHAAFDLLIGQLGATDSPLAALGAAELAGRARLDDSCRLWLLAAVRGRALVTPATLRRAFAAPLGKEVASAWLDYVESSLRAGWKPAEPDLRAMLDAASSVPAERRAALMRLREDGLETLQGRLSELERSLTGGDPLRGRAIFFGAKAACATCHRLDDAGGSVGPDLTRVGATRSGRDLLESIIWPSSTFAQGYEPYSVATTDGRVLDGLIARQDAAVVVLREASGTETRLRRDEIDELRRSPTSLMPAGLERALTQSELGDLLAFLKAQR